MSRSTISTFQLFEMFPDEASARQYLEELKKGMKVVLAPLVIDGEPVEVDRQWPGGAKAGDIVKITSVTVEGMPSDGYGNDYEKLRVSNGSYSWRVSRSAISLIES